VYSYTGVNNMENTMIVLSLRGKVFTVAKDRLIKVVGTYFYGMLSSGAWQPNSDGVYVIDRPSEGFDRILDCLETGKLMCEGLTCYEIDCVYGNLDYFLIPFTRLWDYSKVSKIEVAHLVVYLVLHDKRLCGTTSYRSICIYSMDTNVIEKSMQGHHDTVRGIIQLEDGRLCSCSFDDTIKLWDIESGQCELTIHGHTSTVNCIIQLMDGRLCSGSNDLTIELWNKDSGVCELTIDTDSWTFSMDQLRDGRICSGDDRGNLKVWNIATGVCDMTLDGHDDIVRAIVVIAELRICSCSADKTIKLWNVSSGVCERSLEEHTSYVRDMVLLLDGRLCSVSGDGIVKIWNIDTGVCDLTVRVGASLCKVVQLHDGRLVVSSSDSFAFIIGR
jgi:WD40 repeat protein